VYKSHAFLPKAEYVCTLYYCFYSILIEKCESVFKCQWPSTQEHFNRPELAAEFETLRSIRALSNKALDTARNEKAIKSSLEAKINISTDSQTLHSLLSKFERSEESKEFSLRDILIVSRVTLADQIEEHSPTNQVSRYLHSEVVEFKGEMCPVRVSASVAADSAHHKCPRCWKYTASIEDSLCARCTLALQYIV